MGAATVLILNLKQDSSTSCRETKNSLQVLNKKLIKFIGVQTFQRQATYRMASKMNGRFKDAHLRSIMLPKWATHPAGVTMATMLLFGAAFIIGHHFFYQSLSGKQPPNVVYFGAFAGGLTGQQLNLAAGSVFASLVNSALGVVITTAANQALWVAVRTKPSKLEIIDNLAAATTNIWSLFDFRLWKKSPIRMALVTVFWYACPRYNM